MSTEKDVKDTKNCNGCNQILPIESFRMRSVGYRNSKCRRCMRLQWKRSAYGTAFMKEKGKAKRKKHLADMAQKCVDHFDRTCANPNCPLPKGDWPNGVFEFHHLDPDLKSFGIASGYRKSWSKLKDELDKCAMLCCVCHRTLHAGCWQIDSHRERITP